MLSQFERTADPNEDPDNNGYIVSAKAQAVSAEGDDAPSQFQYLLKHPLGFPQMMLYKLDRLVARTSPRRQGFYVIQIKEAPDTT
jgi:hypothetical protein